MDQHKPAGQPVLDIDNLKVTFATDAGDVHAVKDVSLEVRAGEVLAIVGESGSGKTVTAKAILGLLPETATSGGAVLINGTNIISISAAKLRQVRGRDVAMVFQEPSTALNPVFTVGWQIAEGIRAHGGGPGGKRVSAKEAKARAIDALRKVGIPDPEHRVNYYPHHIGDYSKDTSHLTMLEDAAYRRMLDVYYATEKPLPLDQPADRHVLLEQVGVVLVGIPLRVPGARDTQPEAIGMDLVTHAYILSSTTIVIWLNRRVQGFARPRAPGRNRCSRVPSSAHAALMRSRSTSSW